MHYNEVTKQSCHTKTPEMYPIGIQIVQSKKGGNLVMFSKKISRRSFLKVSAVTTAMAAMGCLPLPQRIRQRKTASRP